MTNADAGGGPLAPLRDVVVVIPAFNEADGIDATLRRLRAGCPGAELVVVDDGSTDGTGRLAGAVDGVRVVSHRRNQGYGAALKTGVRGTRRPYVAWYDGDGQHDPRDLLAIVAPVVLGEADAAIGVRGPDSAAVRERVPGKVVLHWVAQLLAGQRIPDLNSGLRCFRRDVLAPYLYLLPDGFSASTTSTLMLLKRGYVVRYVPITTRARVGTSTVRIVRDGLHTLHLIVRIVVLFDAFRIFTVLGLGLLATGMIYGVAVALLRGAGFPTLAGTAVLAGLLTFFMGIVADQVVELRKERFHEVGPTVAPPTVEP